MLAGRFEESIRSAPRRCRSKRSAWRGARASTSWSAALAAASATPAGSTRSRGHRDRGAVGSPAACSGTRISRLSSSSSGGSRRRGRLAPGERLPSTTACRSRMAADRGRFWAYLDGRWDEALTSRTSDRGGRGRDRDYSTRRCSRCVRGSGSRAATRPEPTRQPARRSARGSDAQAQATRSYARRSRSRAAPRRGGRARVRALARAGHGARSLLAVPDARRRRLGLPRPRARERIARGYPRPTRSRAPGSTRRGDLRRRPCAGGGDHRRHRPSGRCCVRTHSGGGGACGGRTDDEAAERALAPTPSTGTWAARFRQGPDTIGSASAESGRASRQP